VSKQTDSILCRKIPVSVMDDPCKLAAKMLAAGQLLLISISCVVTML
jgi:hypothetical protein